MHSCHLRHHLVVNVQAAGSIDDQDIGMGPARIVQRARNDGHRFLAGIAVAVQRADFGCQCLELQNRRRPVHVNADEHYLCPLFLTKTQRQFGSRRCLAGTLQSCKENYDRGLRP